SRTLTGSIRQDLSHTEETAQLNDAQDQHEERDDENRTFEHSYTTLPCCPVGYVANAHIGARKMTGGRNGPPRRIVTRGSRPVLRTRPSRNWQYQNRMPEPRSPQARA